MNEPQTFYVGTFPLRGDLFVAVEGNHYGAEVRYTATIQILTDPTSSGEELSAGTGLTEAEALGYALLDLVGNGQNVQPKTRAEYGDRLAPDRPRPEDDPVTKPDQDEDE